MQLTFLLKLCYSFYGGWEMYTEKDLADLLKAVEDWMRDCSVYQDMTTKDAMLRTMFRIFEEEARKDAAV